MKTIYKYPLELVDYQTVEMPVGSKILSVADQGGVLCLWAHVTASNPSAKRMFEIAGTGKPFPPNDGAVRVFLGTVVMNPFVWHVFEKLPEPDISDHLA